MSTHAIRDAVHDGDYARAAELFAEWTEETAPAEAALRELADLARWARHAVACDRAHAEARIQAVRDEGRVAAAYRR